ncbi:hypothetical protein [Saccharopolyspora shandongensis]|uniref:hypothetical protein n=1 Tax=Saccharopolyspora shandongensis TaxID=418495 RepID=UPI00340D452D
MLHDMGHFPSGTPATLRAAVLSGRRTVEELVDRYDIRHQGVRQLLLDYLRRREPEMDYSTLDRLSRSLAGLFWAKIEALSPGRPDLRIGADLYKRWREAVGTHQDGRKRREEFEQHCGRRHRRTPSSRHERTLRNMTTIARRQTMCWARPNGRSGTSTVSGQELRHPSCCTTRHFMACAGGVGPLSAL